MKARTIYLFALLSLFTYLKLDAQVHYVSKDNITGNWMDISAWENLPSSQSWASSMPGSTVRSYASSVTVYGTIIYRASNGQDLKFTSATDIIVNDTLIIETGLDGVGGASLTVNAGGVIIVVGDTRLAGAFNIDNDGEVVFVDHVQMTGGTNIDNNGNLYAFNGISTNGGSGYVGIPSPIPDESDLQSNNPTVYNLVQAAVNGTLPIELLSFQLEQDAKGILVKWVTASELNNDFFTVEKSYDGIQYTEIGYTSGSGTSNYQNEYEFFDTDVSISDNYIYYRLKQTDFDGSSNTFSPKVIALQNNNNTFEIVNTYKSGNRIIIDVLSQDDMEIDLSLISLNGNIENKEVFYLKKGANSLSIDHQVSSREHHSYHILNIQSKLKQITKKIQL